MMEYLSNHHEYMIFFKHGVCVDEVFFSTLIRYSPYADKVTNNHLRYMEWEGSTSGGPHVLKKEDFDSMLNSDCVWARKFDNYSNVRDLFETMSKKDSENHA